VTQDDTDDIFAALTEGVDLVMPEDAVDFTTLSSLDLSERYNEVRDELLASGEMRDPTTERGRELHSIRNACLVELKKRRLA
jgi:hypothetical protein